MIHVPRSAEPSRDEQRCRACGAWSEASAERCNRCGRGFGQRSRTLLSRLEQAESLPAPPAAPPPIEKPRDDEWRHELQRRLASYRENLRREESDPSSAAEPGAGKSRLPERAKTPVGRPRASAPKLPPLTRRLAEWKPSSRTTPSPESPEQAPARAIRGDRPAPPIVDLRALREKVQVSARSPRSMPLAAPVSMRLVAGLMDVGLALLGSGLFAAAAHLMTPRALEGEDVTRLMAVAFFLILQFYWFSFVRFAGRTAGMSWLGLRVLNFDGEPPNDGQRWQRAFGTSLSATALGLGFAWAFADEQALTWHDRMSKTLVVAAQDD